MDFNVEHLRKLLVSSPRQADHSELDSPLL
jgi:hypothetical protein